MRRRLASCLVLLALLLGGCWDRTEIEDTVYIASFGVDAAEDEYLWTFRLVTVEQLAVGMLTSPPPTQPGLASKVVTVRGSSLEQALQLVQASVVRVVSLAPFFSRSFAITRCAVVREWWWPWDQPSSFSRATGPFPIPTP